MIAWLSTFLLGLVQAIPIIAKYFPSKVAETTIEEGAAAIDQEIANEQNSGRPAP